MRSIRPFAARLAVLALALLCVAQLSTPAPAAEEILSFDSTIEVRRDGVLIVTETITVRAEGRRIRRGIYRDFPLRFRQPDGTTGYAGFEVMRVERDGRPEPWFTRRPVAGVVRIYIGRKDAFVRPGVHTYVLTYRTTRQIRFFPGHDELYWNVTGDAWAFPIRRAWVEATLPEGAEIIRHALFTGARGSRESAARTLFASGNRFEAETTRTLRPGEGFTIALAFPKGFVREPTARQKLWWRVRDMIGPFWLLAGTAVVLAWLLLAWLRVGRDPAPGVIIPRWRPPAGISPAAAHWIREEAHAVGADRRRAFIAAVTSLATKGFLEIERRGGQTILRRRRMAEGGLPPGEALLMRDLFRFGDSFLIGRANGERLREILRKFAATLDEELERAYVRRNRGHFLIGVALAALTIGGLWVLVALGHASATTPLVMAMFVLLPAFFAGFAIRGMLKARKLSPWFAAPLILFLGALVPAVMGIGLFVATDDGVTLPAGWRLAVFAALLALPLSLLAARHLLPRATIAGRKALDEIEGLRMFIETAEKERLNRAPGRGRRKPPPMSETLFEKLLPWAIALGVEEPWTRAFRKWLAAAMPQAAENYRPGWYSGGSVRDITTMDDSGGLVSALDSGLTAAMPAPSSSTSGFGGGGGAGGGGGGGGGGGW